MNEIIRIKALAFLIMLIMIGSTFVVTANVEHNEVENSATINVDEKDIRVAILTDEKESDDFYGPYGRTRYFMWALKDFSWKVGDTLYNFEVTLLPTKSLLRGKLTTDNYDVLVYPPDTANEKIFFTGFKNLPRNILKRRAITNFIKDGGGYLATCGGAAISVKMENKPKTFLEYMTRNSYLGVSALKMKIDSAIPILSHLAGLDSQAVGTLGYLYYSGWNQTDYDINYHTGLCLDFPISKNNSIFDDYLEETRRIRWLGLPGFAIPENPERKIDVLARFPDGKISDNETFKIHHWRYTGRMRGILKAITYRGGEIHYLENLGILIKGFVFAGDWEQDTLVEVDYSNQPFMTAEEYPNENKARIVLCTGHPEDNVWWGGYIEEIADTEYNNIYDGFYHWKNIIPEEETLEDEFSYNYWILQRSVAWVSRMVPDNDLPPVYGPSQISDINPYNQSSTTNIIGNVETSDGIASLELYYRYSNDNLSWGDWTYYLTDQDGSDGWKGEFDSSTVNGTGYYQFYSIRRVEYENHTEIERAPPGPDAFIYVE